MSCYSCMKEFKRFNKPHTCPQCRRAFCSNCLKYDDPTSGSQKVCLACHRRSERSRLEQDNEVLKNFKDRYYRPIHQAKNVPHYKPKVTSSSEGADGSQASGQASRFGFTDPQDIELELRFRELKGPLVVPPSEAELRFRMEHFHSDDPNTTHDSGGQSHDSAFPSVRPPKTEAQQSDDLMKQMKDEAALERRAHGKDEGLPGHVDDTGSQEEFPSARSELDKLGQAGSAGEQKHRSREDEPIDPVELERMLDEARRLLDAEKAATEQNDRFIAEASNRLEGISGGSGSHDIPSVPGGGAVGGESKFKWGPGSEVPDYGDFLFEGEDGDDFDVEIQRLIAQMVEESKLEEKLETAGISPDEVEQQASRRGELRATSAAAAHPQSKGLPQATALSPPPCPTASKISYPVDELPWCCICNDDAAIVCQDCHNDLYCMRCFKHGHEEFAMYSHRYQLYEKPDAT